MQDSWALQLGTAFVLCCFVPIIGIGMVAFFALRAGQRTLGGVLSPDPAAMQTQFERLRARYPNATREELVRRIIHDQSLRCGLVGAVTGLGGFVTLPIALPVDILATLRIQSAMVSFIALAYGRRNISEVEQGITTYLVMTGSRQIAERSVGFVLSFTARVLGKTFSKLIPVIGAATSFAVNYALTQAIGRVAVERYGGRLQTP